MQQLWVSVWNNQLNMCEGSCKMKVYIRQEEVGHTSLNEATKQSWKCCVLEDITKKVQVHVAQICIALNNTLHFNTKTPLRTRFRSNV